MYILHICTSFTKEILEDVTCEKKKVITLKQSCLPFTSAFNHPIFISHILKVTHVIQSRPNIVVIIARNSIVNSLYYHCFTTSILFLNYSKDYFICFATLLIVSLRARWEVPVMMLLLLLWLLLNMLLLLLNLAIITIPSIIVRLTLLCTRYNLFFF